MTNTRRALVVAVVFCFLSLPFVSAAQKARTMHRIGWLAPGPPLPNGFGWINQMWVTPSLVGKGIGSNLLRHALTVLEPPIRLYTFQANSGARRFYERYGFQAIEFTDGQSNEERCPDVLFELQFVVSESGG